MAALKSYTAYFDASGHPKDTPGVLFITGFVAPIEKWLTFEDQWLSLLHKHDIKPPFHMTDFSTQAVGTQYEPWAGDIKRQTVFHKDVRPILKPLNKSFAQGVVIAELNRLRREYELPKQHHFHTSCADAYTYCAVGVFLQIDKWRKKRLKGGEPLEIVYECGDEYQPRFGKHAREHLGFEPMFRSKETTVPLQAADYLAWEHRKVITGLIKKDRRKPRAVILELVRRLPGSPEWVYTDRQRLELMCKEMGFPKKQRQ